MALSWLLLFPVGVLGGLSAWAYRGPAFRPRGLRRALPWAGAGRLAMSLLEVASLALFGPARVEVMLLGLPWVLGIDGLGSAFGALLAILTWALLRFTAVHLDGEPREGPFTGALLLALAAGWLLAHGQSWAPILVALAVQGWAVAQLLGQGLDAVIERLQAGELGLDGLRVCAGAAPRSIFAGVETPVASEIQRNAFAASITITVRDVESVVTPSRPSMPKPVNTQSRALHGPKCALISLTSVRPPRPFTMSCKPHAPAWSSLNVAPYVPSAWSVTDAATTVRPSGANRGAKLMMPLSEDSTRR